MPHSCPVLLGPAWLRVTCAVALALAACMATFAAGAQTSRDTARKLDKAEQALKQVAAERRKVEGKRSDASKQLRVVDEKLGTSSRTLHDTETDLARERKKLEQLEQQRDAMRDKLGAQRKELEALLRAAYTIGDDASLKLLLAQDEVARANRLLTLHRYLQDDRARRITELTTELHDLDVLQQQVVERQQALDAIRARQKTQLAQLQTDRKTRAKTADELEKSYHDKRSREKALGSDVKGLKTLLSQLRAAAARAETARRAAAAERAARAKSGPTPSGKRPPPPVIANATAIRVGGLGWPLSGALLAGYGGKLPDGSASTGLLIGAQTGTQVDAVANGKVVFSDWMNGYGLLLIIDHGNGYMSLYAHNESLLRDTGDNVKRGDPVASVGSSGGANPPALYFELRHNGDPVNPSVWLKKQ